MRYIPGQEHYVLTYPKPGAVSFWRCWPMESPVDVLLANGEPIQERAKAMLVCGFRKVKRPRRARPGGAKDGDLGG